jgi:hypothetical protein
MIENPHRMLSDDDSPFKTAAGVVTPVNLPTRPSWIFTIPSVKMKTHLLMD